MSVCPTWRTGGWNRLRRILVSLGGTSLALTVSLPVARAEPLKLRLGVISPQGTLFTDFLESSMRDALGATAGRVDFTLYASGVLGTEEEMIEKLRSGELDMVALSDFGLGTIVPETRFLHLPLLVTDHKEARHVVAGLFGRFKNEFEDRGVVLLMWTPTGPAYLFGNKPGQTMADLKGARLWMWPGDVHLQTVFGELPGVIPVPLPLSEVRDALKQNRLDGFLIVPIISIAFQWYPYVRWVIEPPFAMSSVALVANRRAWERLDPRDRATLEAVAEKRGRILAAKSAEENAVAVWGLKKHGVVFQSLPAVTMGEIEEMARRVRAKMEGTVYSRELLQSVDQLLAEYRSSRARAVPSAPAR